MKRHVDRSALVPFSAREMYVLVDDIAAYQDFLPWCRSSTVHSRDGNIVEATLELEKGGVSKGFRTRNTCTENEAIDIALVGGPFRTLRGGWKFSDIGEEGSRVALKVDFEFESMLVDFAFGAFFEDTCNSLVDAFTRRAEQVFGPR